MENLQIGYAIQNCTFLAAVCINHTLDRKWRFFLFFSFLLKRDKKKKRTAICWEWQWSLMHPLAIRRNNSIARLEALCMDPMAVVYLRRQCLQFENRIGFRTESLSICITNDWLRDAMPFVFICDLMRIDWAVHLFYARTQNAW